MQENSEHGGGMVEEEKAGLVVADKVDWKGRKALKHQHGGTSSTLLILGSHVSSHYICTKLKH